MDVRHWDRVYAEGDEERSWYQEHAEVSARLISTGGDRADSVIDVGGGASTLVDDLVAMGYRDLTVLDISARALDLARSRLGFRASEVQWVTADLLTWTPANRYDIWHDRAVLHFLTDPSEHARYRDRLQAATAAGSRVVIGVFGPHGPQRCSGLPVLRFDAADLADVLGPAFTLTHSFTQLHQTPAGAEQEFLWATARRNR